jgi:hypothetical protein
MNPGKNKSAEKGIEKLEAFIYDQDAKGSFADFYAIAEKVGMHYV